MKKGLLTFVLAILVSTQALALDRAKIAESAEQVTPLLNGQTIPNTQVNLADGTPVSLKALTMQKPSILIFYRGGWCPYCNRQLVELKSIEQPLVDMGYQILAISPESPARLREQKLQTKFAAQVISDHSLDTIRQFGLGFYVEDKTKQKYKSKMNVDLTHDSEQRPVLPAPAVYIVDQEGVIQFNYVNPNYAVRPSAEMILNVAKSL